MKKTLLFLALLLAQGAFAQNWHFAKMSDTEAWLVNYKHKHMHGDQEVDAYCHCYSGDIVIPSSTPEGLAVTGVGKECFIDCGITSVVIPASVDTICHAAFKGCALKKVTLADADTELHLACIVGNDYSTLNTFWGEGGYEEVYIGRNYSTYTGAVTFGGYLSVMKKLTIGPKVTRINDYAFRDNVELTEVEFLSDQGLKSIGKGAFRNCPKLAAAVLPNSVSFMGEQAFSGCSALQSINIPASLDIIRYETFSGCSTLTSLTVPANVDSICVRAFSGCTAMKSFTVADGGEPLKLAGGFNSPLFSEDIPLGSIHIGRNLALDPHPPFSGTPIKTVVIGSKVNEILDYTYGNMREVSDLYCYAVYPPKCYPNAFTYVDDLKGHAVLHVLPASLAAYKAADVWKDFFNIQPLDYDLNGDGDVNVGDVTSLVNMILGKADKAEAADLNNDGDVNVGDVTTLVNIILGK